MSAGKTVIEFLKASIEAASRHNSNDVVAPVAILWPDRDSQWQPIIPQLRCLMPQLLTFGKYDPEQRTGPAIWLRCATGRALASPKIPDDMIPIIYLPGVSRQDLNAAGTCPDRLKPLVELQYRGVCWTQKNGKDWTMEAFLVSKDGGLGLDVAHDAATRLSVLRALTELATASLEMLQGKRLDADDFDRLFSDDPVRDVLTWLSDPETVQPRLDVGRWSAFKSRCRADLGFDPEKDGALVAAERLGGREGSWETVWRRFAESPALYTGIPELLRKAMPGDLFVERSSWPQGNEEDEKALHRALLSLEDQTPAEARKKVLELEKTHSARRGWVWAKLGDAPLACALAHLARIAEHASNELGGTSIADMAKLYGEGAWQVDAAALSSVAAVKSDRDRKAVSKVLHVIYRPWLESAARHLQGLAEMEPLPGRDGQNVADIRVEAGGLIFFADGLRYDVSQQLVKRLQERGCLVVPSMRWAGLPTVTSTAKPAVSPVTDQIEGHSIGEDFLPTASDTGQPLTTDRFRKLLDTAGYQFIRVDETGDPSGRGWTENGELDKLGHSLQGKLAARIDDQVEQLLERIESLFEAGWREIRVVTDHGWLWLPGGLPKVDLPKYLTVSRWARCASIKGGSTVEVPTVRWHWNTHERIAVAPGIACFGAGNEYAHGGLSLQESLVPIIRITVGTRSANAGVHVTDVTWVGLRCRVRIDAPQTGLFVDLRTRVNDASSSLSKAQPVDGKGTAKLLVADDKFEGTPAAIVVLDAGGHVIARQSTIIGGES